ncbi:putative D-amino-acid transaminase, Aminodeoxychorismate lyase [Rosa chinensis]|uniref:Putative D-amino-acid transaminase, Aminodeoxychorismate lyase n=1 Tax=Rosa chinensis TaxID=74649 RepID=A0A2P6PSN4_ROSCH|nr:putative D-amino-acid transaminase, Aminodeoxychorismate lyase [Rosa chinensis]
MFLFIVNILGAFVVDLLSIVCFVEDSLEVGNVEDFKVHVFKSSSELLEKLHEKWSKVGKKPYPAMYSSIYGGIILDPALMVIPIDDHMVHRGHGVFDTAILLNGYLYELDVHLNRFLRSASKARIPSPFDRSTLRSINSCATGGRVTDQERNSKILDECRSW